MSQVEVGEVKEDGETYRLQLFEAFSEESVMWPGSVVVFQVFNGIK